MKLDNIITKAEEKYSDEHVKIVDNVSMISIDDAAQYDQIMDVLNDILPDLFFNNFFDDDDPAIPSTLQTRYESLPDDLAVARMLNAAIEIANDESKQRYENSGNQSDEFFEAIDNIKFFLG